MTKDTFITNAIINGEAATLKAAQVLWTAYREENGMQSGGYQDGLHELLIEAPMSELELDDWIEVQVELGFKADKYRSVFLKTMNLANAIHSKYS
jgi:hypothetical protein